jgi:DNA-binding LacI/PurR family transcriptional regulator
VFATVRIDNVSAGRDAVDHLVELGHTRVGFISANAKSKTSRDRQRGYRAALEAAGISFDAELVSDGDYTEEGGYAAANRLLQLANAPTAIFAANDRMAAGAMAAVFDRGLNVPQDVSLVGFDDVPMASYLRPSLTTVSLSAHELGVRAMELLAREIDGQPARKRIRVKTRLVVRDSCVARDSHVAADRAVTTA